MILDCWLHEESYDCHYVTILSTICVILADIIRLIAAKCEPILRQHFFSLWNVPVYFIRLPKDLWLENNKTLWC